jgi:FkbM family methyltransferase
MASVLVGNKGKVISIEPDPRNFQSLSDNVKLNNLTNVILIQNALFSESNKTVPFHQEGTMSRFILSPEVEPEVDILVQTKTLDDIIKKYSLVPTILEMDIEGAEEYALYGMEKSLQSIRCIGAEIHNKNCYNAFIENYPTKNIREFPAESLTNVINFLIKHPVIILKLESIIDLVLQGEF